MGKGPLAYEPVAVVACPGDDGMLFSSKSGAMDEMSEMRSGIFGAHLQTSRGTV